MSNIEPVIIFMTVYIDMFGSGICGEGSGIGDVFGIDVVVFWIYDGR